MKNIRLEKGELKYLGDNYFGFKRDGLPLITSNVGEYVNVKIGKNTIEFMVHTISRTKDMVTMENPFKHWESEIIMQKVIRGSE